MVDQEIISRLTIHIALCEQLNFARKTLSTLMSAKQAIKLSAVLTTVYHSVAKMNTIQNGKFDLTFKS